MDSRVANIITVIHDIVTEHNFDPDAVYGTTYYTDTRLALLLCTLHEEDKELSRNQKQRLASALKQFSHSLSTNNDGSLTYFLPGSGTHELGLSRSTLLRLVEGFEES